MRNSLLDPGRESEQNKKMAERNRIADSYQRYIENERQRSLAQDAFWSGKEYEKTPGEKFTLFANTSFIGGCIQIVLMAALAFGLVALLCGWIR